MKNWFANTITKIGIVVFSSKRFRETLAITLRLFQEIALFSGTLRFNLDPMDKYSDDHIWECIRNAKMNDYIEKMPNGLGTQIETDGLGLSNGEKQVISCLRGLLGKE